MGIPADWVMMALFALPLVVAATLGNTGEIAASGVRAFGLLVGGVVVGGLILGVAALTIDPVYVGGSAFLLQLLGALSDWLATLPLLR
jgi:hypothetical protein